MIGQAIYGSVYRIFRDMGFGFSYGLSHVHLDTFDSVHLSV